MASSARIIIKMFSPKNSWLYRITPPSRQPTNVLRKYDMPQSNPPLGDRQSHTERPSNVPWPPLALAAVIIAAVALSYAIPITWPGLNDLPARIVGLSIGAGGIVLMAWSLTTLMRARTTFQPHKRSENLVTTGPYARFRNPIYIADVMLLLGAAELSKNVWLVAGAAAFVILVTWLAILPEERHLEARFGDDYRSYKARTRRWL